MHYRFDEKNSENEVYFCYKPKRKNDKNKTYKKINKNDSPFKVLNSINFDQR